MKEPRELTGDSRIEVNGYRDSWAKFLDANEFGIAEIRKMHDELLSSGVTTYGGGALAENEIRLVRP